jgi:M6 family metalloprotease-like protein
MISPILLIHVATFHQPAYSDSASLPGTETAREYVTLIGLLNARELIHFNGTSSIDFMLISDDNAGQEAINYVLDFSNDPDRWSESELLSMAGTEIVIEGYLQPTENGDAPSTPSEAGARDRDFTEVRVLVSHLTTFESGEDSMPGSVRANSLDAQFVPSVQHLKQVVVPARYSGSGLTPHSEEYYSGQFYLDSTYSLAAYWRDASYGKFLLEGEVVPWIDLPASEDHYLTFGGRESDLVEAADHLIDFDGPDNELQNVSTENFRANQQSDDIDALIGIYNGMIGSDIAGYSYVSPIPVSTDEGSLYVYFIAISDIGYGSPSGVPSNYFVGLAAHEMGHNFGWYHTATRFCIYCDPWSLMSGGIYSESGPSGPIASHRESQGWIDPERIIEINAPDRPGNATTEFSLDVLGGKIGQGYLMAKIPFGDDGHYYTLEARNSTINDHTPLEQDGIVIYHYSPAGHAHSMEPSSRETIIDTTGMGDLINANLGVGEAYEDSENGIIIVNVAEIDGSIAVRVIRGQQIVNTPDYRCNGLHATILGTTGDDNLIGTDQDDVIMGLEGNDTIYGMGGNDTLCGGHGNDIIEGEKGDDSLFGNVGDDSLTGGAGNDLIFGGRGSDHLTGGQGNDILEGWSGDDRLYGEDGDDMLYGGDGSDYLIGGDGSDKLRGWLGIDIYADKSEVDSN